MKECQELFFNMPDNGVGGWGNHRLVEGGEPELHEELKL